MKNTTKKIVALLVAVLLSATTLVGLASCKEEGSYTIGICQLVKHDALDAATQGFKDAVIAGLGEENVTFIYNEAQGESNTCATIVNDYVTKNVDLIMANATAALQAAYNATTSIPILGTSITDYASALSITNFNGTCGGNISGTSDLAPLSDQAQMIKDLMPTAQKVGILYCSSEANSKYQADTIKPILEGLGFTVNCYTFTDTNDVVSVTNSADAWADVLYVPTDNTAASCANTIKSSSTKPIFAGEENCCKNCGIATLSISYYSLGYKTGEMAVQILKGEKNISEMPIQYADNFTKKYNATIAAEFPSITIPADFVAIAD